MNHVVRPALMLLAAILSTPVWAVDVPAPSEFAWRGTLTLPADASVVRMTLPPDAMVRLQSSDARDVRVFNAAGEAVAFAFATPTRATPGPVPPQTRPYTAYPLFAAANGTRPAKGSVQVHLDNTVSQGSVWVRFGDAGSTVGAPDASASRLQSALFDTRDDKQTIAALTLQADLPPNALVHFSLASSTDLAQWTPVALRGPAFRFEGAGAPSNHTLELVQALQLEGRYLRLSWNGQTGVQVNSVTGNVAQAWVPPTRVRALLSPAVPDGTSSMTWTLDFATPLAALHLNASRSNTLVPVRILGRNDAAQPWRHLATTLVYRLGSPGQETSNPPVALGGASVRWLRVEATHGMALPGLDLQATAEFEPVQIVFLTSGQAPFEVALGRPRTLAAAMDVSLLSSVIPGKLDDLPRATVAGVRFAQEASSGSSIKRWLPEGTGPRSIVLWIVLVGGVALLAGVAYALLRQLSVRPAPQAEIAGPPSVGST